MTTTETQCQCSDTGCAVHEGQAGCPRAWGEVVYRLADGAPLHVCGACAEDVTGGEEWTREEVF